MRKENLWILDIIIRYLLVALAFLIIPLFYIIFSPLTIHLTSWIMSLFYSVQVYGNTLFFSEYNASIEIVDACVAGSAYFLLFILNLLTREIKISKRIYALLFSFACLFLVNVIRLVIIIPMFLNNSSWFDFTHKFFWWVLSVVFVVLIWILTTKVFRIMENGKHFRDAEKPCFSSISKIPVYSDVAYVIKKVKSKAKS